MVQNGGAEQTSLDYLRCVHGLADSNTGFYTFKHLFSEIEYIVFQTSQPPRNTHYYVSKSLHDGNEYELKEMCKCTLEDWLKRVVAAVVQVFFPSALISVRNMLSL